MVEYDAAIGDVCCLLMYLFESVLGCNLLGMMLWMLREVLLVVSDFEGWCAVVVLREDGVAGKVRVLLSVDGGLGLVVNDDEGCV